MCVAVLLEVNVCVAAVEKGRHGGFVFMGMLSCFF